MNVNVLGWRIAILLGCVAQAGCHAPKATTGDPIDALKTGNQRFLAGKARHPHLDAKLRHDLAVEGQHPFATILACSDSRVPVELLFDQGIGDLFVIRVAGNVVDTDETGSIEYAVEHLHCPLIVVLGHRHCGAVTAAVHHEEDTPSIEGLLKHIDPAVREARRVAADADEETLIDEAVRQNVWRSVSDLLTSSKLCRDAVRSGDLEIVGAIYDIDSGGVEWLGRHPREIQLLRS